ncbi:MAG: FHA domain-containing protein [Magnetococcales bacterium]|nr:FHA domain-containing protein [Magnetococcales bacterium]
MTSLKELVDETGQFDYNALKRLAKGQDQATFVRLVSEMVLVGSGLYRGWLLGDGKKEGEEDKKETVLFQPEERRQKATQFKVLETYIFPLIPVKQRDEESHGKNVHVVTVGRSKKCDIILSDPSISSKHAEFRMDKGDGTSGPACFVRDLGSSNGVFVNGSRLAPFWTKDLAIGDEIRLSRFSIILSRAIDVYPKLKFG